MLQFLYVLMHILPLEIHVTHKIPEKKTQIFLSQLFNLSCLSFDPLKSISIICFWFHYRCGLRLSLSFNFLLHFPSRESLTLFLPCNVFISLSREKIFKWVVFSIFLSDGLPAWCSLKIYCISLKQGVARNFWGGCLNYFSSNVFRNIKFYNFFLWKCHLDFISIY